MFEIRKNPTSRELRLFGVALFLFFGVIGALLRWKWQYGSASSWIWIGALLFLLFYLAVPASRRPVYLGWSYLTFPLGWLISHLVLALVFYLVLTPVGLLLRMFGRDPLERKIDRQSRTYWTSHRPKEDTESYFRQY